jgi:hypothetical protein
MSQARVTLDFSMLKINLDEGVIDPKYFSKYLTNAGDKRVGISVLTDPDSIMLRQTLLKICLNEFSSENWIFITELHRLNSQKHISQQDFNYIIHEFIKPGARSNINISSKNRADILGKQADAAHQWTLADFANAANEIMKLLCGDTLTRATHANNLPLIKEAISQDYTKGGSQLKANTNKIDLGYALPRLQLEVCEVLAALDKYISQYTAEEPADEKTASASFWQPSKSITFADMRQELAKLLKDSDSPAMTFLKFKEAYEKFIKKYQPVLKASHDKIQEQQSMIINNLSTKIKLPGTPVSKFESPLFQAVNNQFRAQVLIMSKIDSPMPASAADVARTKAFGITPKVDTILESKAEHSARSSSLSKSVSGSC